VAGKQDAVKRSAKYKKILFNDVVYCVGDYLLFRETNKTTIVGRLAEILPEGGYHSHPKWPMLRVQWFYKKQDLDTKKVGVPEEDLKFIGENEVFPSNHFDKVFADAIC